MLSKLADLGMTNVPHKGAPQALAEVEAGDIAMMFVDVATALQKVRDGKLVVLEAAVPGAETKTSAMAKQLKQLGWKSALVVDAVARA